MTHYEKYEALVQKMGVDKLKTCVMRVLGNCQHADPAEVVRHHLKIDANLSSIPITKWDSQEPVVRGLYRKAGGGFLSTAECVCVLKHVARHHIADVPAPQEIP